MAISDVSPPPLAAPSKRRVGAEAYILIIGVAAVLAFAVCSLIYEPSYQEKQQAMQAALTMEHTKVCAQLGRSDGSDRDSCLKLMDGLYMTHQRAILADSSEI